jgi:hypothetical protein
MDGTIDVIIPVHAETDRALESPTRPLPQSYPCSPDTEFSAASSRARHRRHPDARNSHAGQVPQPEPQSWWCVRSPK